MHVTMTSDRAVYLIHRTWDGDTCLMPVCHDRQAVSQLILADLQEYSDPDDGDTVPEGTAEIDARTMPIAEEGPYRQAWSLAWDDLEYVIEEQEVLRAQG